MSALKAMSPARLIKRKDQVNDTADPGKQPRDNANESLPPTSEVNKNRPQTRRLSAREKFYALFREPHPVDR